MKRGPWRISLLLISLVCLTAVAQTKQTMVACTTTVTLGDSGAEKVTRKIAKNALLQAHPLVIDSAGLRAIEKLTGPLDISSNNRNQLYQFIVPRYINEADAASEKCGNAALDLGKALSDTTNSYGGPGGGSLFLWLASTTNSYVINNRADALRPVSEALRSYDAACLENETDQSLLARSVGYLVLSNGLSLCTAYRTGPDTILTARHCLYDPGTNTVQPLLKTTTLSFGYLPDKVHTYQVCSEVRSPVKAGDKAFSEKDDYIELKLSASPGPYSKIPALARPLKDGDSLKLFGLFPDLQLVTSAGDVGMRDTKVAGCTVRTHSSTCIVHACQSESGTSGAPIFVTDGNGNLQFAGLHVGSYPMDTSCPTPNPADGNYNQGVVVPPL